MRYTIFDIPILRNLLHIISIAVLRIFGWHRSGKLPNIPKFVMIAAPHTSNWDFPITLALAFAFKMNFNWFGKDSLFRWPFGGIFKWLGGIPINRTKSGDVVTHMIRVFKEKAYMILVIAPEGTRKKVRHWKTGFYHIALGANVPIVLGFLDYVRKAGGFGPTLMPTGNIEYDMEIIRVFYETITGKAPEKSTPAHIHSQIR
jgi:1-acyl-sn-glycerol-3-phosphate acyltransferase